MFGEAPGKLERADPKLVGVLDSTDQFALASATAALSEAKIIFATVAISDVPANLKTGNPNWWTRPTRILVAAEHEAEARMLVEPFQEPVSDSHASQRNDILWHGSSNPSRVQRIGVWSIGLVFVVTGLITLSGAVRDRIKDGFSISVIIEAAFALSIVAIGIRMFRNGFPRHTKPAAK